jgi:hypothetical protein
MEKIQYYYYYNGMGYLRGALGGSIRWSVLKVGMSQSLNNNSSFSVKGHFSIFFQQAPIQGQPKYLTTV